MDPVTYDNPLTNAFPSANIANILSPEGDANILSIEDNGNEISSGLHEYPSRFNIRTVVAARVENCAGLITLAFSELSYLIYVIFQGQQCCMRLQRLWCDTLFGLDSLCTSKLIFADSCLIFPPA